MAKGLPKSIIAKYGISKKAWDIYRGLKRKGKVNKSATTSKHRGRTMAKRFRRKFHRRAKKTIAIAPVLGTAASIAFLPRRNGTASAASLMMKGDFESGAWVAIQNLTGFSRFENQWNIMNLIHGWMPILGGVFAHYLANFTGINRHFAKLPAPLNKVRI